MFTSQRSRARAAFVLAATVALLSTAEFLHLARGTQLDFATRYAAGLVVANGSSPYDQGALDAAERQVQGYDFQYPFRDPPPTASFFRVVSAAPYRDAQLAWTAASILAAILCALLTVRLLGIRSRGASAMALVAASGLAFAPLRNGIAEGQLDPLVGALALLAFTVRTPLLGGVLQSIATMKPQTALLASAGGLNRHRLRFAAGMAIGYAALVLLTTQVEGPGWRRWIRVVRGASHHHSPWLIGLGAIALLAILAAGVLAYRSLRAVGVEPGLAILAPAICVNALVLPFVFLNLQSDVLVMVPLLLVAARARLTRGRDLVLGAIAGIFFVDGLFAITSTRGVAHAAVPIALAVLLGSAAALSFPARRAAIGVALAVNIAVTIPPFQPGAYRWFSVVAAAALLGLLVQMRGSTGSAAGPVTA